MQNLGTNKNDLYVHLLRLVDLNMMDQLIEHPGRQLLCPGVFADDAQKRLGGHGVTGGFVYRRLEVLDLRNHFLLFHFIFGRHPGEPLTAPAYSSKGRKSATDPRVMFAVCGAHDLVGVVAQLAAVVDFQLHAVH